MKKASKLALGALALSLIPFELKWGKDGEFSCQSLLIGLSRNKIEDGRQNLVLNMFNVPSFLKKKKAEIPADTQGEEDARERTEEPSPADQSVQ